MSIRIIDTRPEWIKKEDELMKCAWLCPLFKKCMTRFGNECKRFGGNEIPKIKG